MISIKEKKFKIIAKPNASETKIERFDSERNAYIISVRAKPEDNKANIELIKFLSRELKGKARIVSGFRGKEKIIELMQ